MDCDEFVERSSMMQLDNNLAENANLADISQNNSAEESNPSE
jgi:hypothetical protein